MKVPARRNATHGLVAVGTAMILLFSLSACAARRPTAQRESAKPAPSAASTSASDPIVQKAVRYAGGDQGRIVGYVVDFRLDTKSIPNGTLELVILEDGKLRIQKSSLGTPLGAWESTPAPRAAPLSPQERVKQDSLVTAAVQAIPEAAPAGYRPVDIKASQVFAYVVRVDVSGESVDVEVDTAAKRASKMNPLESWPPRP